jgi:23S rRNA (guanine2445-N2)-methyltransferase / 23S rRNA (guanine2069-N7)-methyltransferase
LPHCTRLWAAPTTSTSIDSSATYLDWFNANLALNGLSDRQHRGVRADVRDWLSEETRTYDLIMVDPPSFSNSKGQSDFDVQRDHLSLLQLAMARLSEGGDTVLFHQPSKICIGPGGRADMAGARRHAGFNPRRFLP